MVDHDLLCHERDLLEEILNDGHLPIVLTADEPTAVHLPAGLHTDTRTHTDRRNRPVVPASRVAEPSQQSMSRAR